MTVWRMESRPFAFGSTRQPISTSIEVGEPVPLGGGYYGYTYQHPALKQPFVFESETGGLVGNSLAQVRADVAKSLEQGKSGQQIIEQQLVEARAMLGKARHVTNDYFFG